MSMQIYNFFYALFLFDKTLKEKTNNKIDTLTIFNYQFVCNLSLFYFLTVYFMLTVQVDTQYVYRMDIHATILYFYSPFSFMVVFCFITYLVFSPNFRYLCTNVRTFENFTEYDKIDGGRKEKHNIIVSGGEGGKVRAEGK